MRCTIEIENIESMRIHAGIYDVRLRREIRLLRAGDSVNLTFRTSDVPFGGETLRVRITSFGSDHIRGRLTEEPSSASLSALRVGTPVRFTYDHIHSLPRERGPSKRRRIEVSAPHRSRHQCDSGS